MEEFLNDGGEQALFALLGRSFRKSDSFDLCDSTDLLDASNLAALWGKIKSCTEVLIDKLELQSDEAAVPNKQAEVEMLKSLTNFLMQYLEGNHRRPHSFLATLEMLHDLLIPLDDDIAGAKSLKSSIAKTCEYYYLNGCEGADAILPQLIPYLLMVVTSSQNNVVKEVDIKRLYGMRSAIVLLDFNDPSIESIQELLVECFKQPAVLRSSDGRKFLSFVFTLEDVLHTPVVQTMKGFLVGGIVAGAGLQAAPMSTKDVAEAYADVLLRAWKELSSSVGAAAASVLTRDGDGPLPRKPKKNKRLQEEMEQEAHRIESSWTGGDDGSASLLASFELGVMQMLLHDAVHASNLKYFKGLFTIMQSFHNEKNSRGMDSFLIKIYSPIIWRSLKCSNAMVRAQATTLFCDVFPLRANNTSAAEDDECMQKHFNVFTLLLKDADHRVRSSAVTGICKVLKDFWEPIPPSIASTILAYMINTLSKDSSCANVRVAVIAGMRMLLEYCPLSHTSLRNLLPFLSNSVHDTSEKVRLECVLLLNKVKDVRDMHFYDIVPPEQLLQRLVLDCNKPAICSALTALLLANFYPQQMPTTASAGNDGVDTNINDLQLHRCLALIQQDVRCAVAFYYSLHKHASLGSTTKFAVNLLVSFNSDMDEIYETIDSVLTGGAGGRSGNDERTRHVLIKSLVPTLEVPLGMLQVLLGIVLSVKDKLKITMSSPESNGTADLFRKYFTSSSLHNMFQLMFNAIDRLFLKNHNSPAAMAPQLFATMSVMWALHLQLVSVCVSIDPGFSAPVASEGKRGKKSAASAGNARLEPSALFVSSLKVLDSGMVLLDNVRYANIVQMMALAILDSMCSLSYEVPMISKIVSSIENSNTPDGEDIHIALPLAVCLLSNVIESQKIEQEIMEGCLHQCVSKIVSKDSYSCSMLINYGFPQHLEHIKSSRGCAFDALTKFFPACATAFELNASAEDAQSDQVAAVCKCVLLWVSHCIQNCHRGGSAQSGHDSSDYVDSLAAPQQDSNITTRQALDACFQWVSKALVPRICSAHSPPVLVQLFDCILGLVGDFLVVFSAAAPSTLSDVLAVVVSHTTQWLQLLILSDNSFGDISTQLQRLCFLVTCSFRDVVLGRYVAILLAKQVVKHPQVTEAAAIANLIVHLHERDAEAASSFLVDSIFTMFALTKPNPPGANENTERKCPQFLMCISALFDGSQENNDGAYQCMKTILMEWRIEDKFFVDEAEACFAIIGMDIDKDSLLLEFWRVLVDVQEEL